MQIDVPEKRGRREPPAAPPGGWHDAHVHAANAAANVLTIEWQLRAEGRRWRVSETLAGREITDALHDLGFAGQRVELDAFLGARGRIELITRGGRRSAEIVAHAPAA